MLATKLIDELPVLPKSNVKKFTLAVNVYAIMLWNQNSMKNSVLTFSRCSDCNLNHVLGWCA